MNIVGSARITTAKGTDVDIVRKIPPEVRRQLGWYVYLYIDPRSNTPIYVGKGKGSRALAHLSSGGETEKGRIFQEIEDSGLVPRIDIVARKVSELEAFRIEAALIDVLRDLFGDRLLNLSRGYESNELGRMPLQRVIDLYSARDVLVAHPVILIRISRQFPYDMTEEQLYEATRRAWKLSARRDSAKFVFAVFEGVVQEVYEVQEWHSDAELPKLWEFTGTIASRSIRSRYKGGRVEKYFRPGQQFPITYLNC